MKQNGWLPVLLGLVLLTNLILLGIVIFQLDTLEERAIQQSAQFRSLAEGTDRVRGELRRLLAAIGSGDLQSLSGASAAEPSSGRRWLHPEVPNLLEPHDFQINDPKAQTNGTLRRWYGGEPKGFNVMIENAADMRALWGLVGATPASRMDWSDPDHWYGRIAERVEVTRGNKEFTIYLKEGVRWHRPGSIDLDDPRYAWLAGDHVLTAHDVAFSLRLLKDPQVENGFAKNYYEQLESWEVVDDHTIIIRWSEALYNALESTLTLDVVPEFLYAYDEEGTRFPDESLGLNFNQHWFNNKAMIGTGPYRMVSYEPGVAIRLERNEDYHGPLPAIQTLVYEIFTDDNLRLLKLRSHEHDFGGLRASQYQDLIRKWEDVPREEWPENNPFLDGSISHRRYTGMSYFYLGWNQDKPLFSDVRVRRAMTFALNRQEIIDSVFVGLGRIPPGHYFALSPYNDPDIKPIPFDLDQARALLEEAGWTDSDGDGLRDRDLDPDDGMDERVPFEFSLLIYASSPEMASLANIYKEDLLKVGVRMQIESAEWSLMQKRMNEREFDAFTGGWALSWDPDPYQIFHSSQADVPKGSNMVGFRNAEADQIMESLRRTFDADERMTLLRRLHRIFHDDQVYSLLIVRDSVACWWDNVQRVVFAKTRPHARSLPWWVESEY